MLIEAIAEMPAATVQEERDRSAAISAVNYAAICTARAGQCGESRELWRAYARLSWAADMSDAEFEKVEGANFHRQMRECAAP